MDGWTCGKCGHFLTYKHKPIKCPQCGNRQGFIRNGGESDD